MRSGLMIVAGMLGALVSVPASAALKVTNLSHDTQTVLFDAAGSKKEYMVAPDATIYITGPDGKLSLKNAKPTAGDGSVIGTRNTFFGYTDTARSQGAPASQMDEFVIWPDGRLMFQKRNKSGGSVR